MRCSLHGLRPLGEYKQCSECDFSYSQVCNSKISTRKEIVQINLLIDVFTNNITYHKLRKLNFIYHMSKYWALIIKKSNEYKHLRYGQTIKTSKQEDILQTYLIRRFAINTQLE